MALGNLPSLYLEFMANSCKTIVTDRNNPSVILSEVFFNEKAIASINLIHLITVYLHVNGGKMRSYCAIGSLSYCL